MKTFKRSIAALLSILLILSLVTVAASAADSGNVTIKFTNNLKWENVYVYAWTGNGGEGNENASWPGVKMTEIGDNGYGAKNFQAPYTPGYNLVFNDGTDANKTQDIKYNSAAEGYWLNGKTVKNNEDKDVYVALVWGDTGEGTQPATGSTDETVVYGDPANEGTYTATLDAGKLAGDGSWYAWTWTHNGEWGHFVEGTVSGNKITFAGLCNRVNFASFDGEPKKDWSNKVAETKELHLYNGGTFKLTGKVGDIYSGSWSGGTLAPEVQTTVPATGSTDETVEYGDPANEGTYTATLDAGSYKNDGSWYAWTWTHNGEWGHFVEGTVSGNKVTFEGLCNRVNFASFVGAPKEDDWSNKVAETKELHLYYGGTFTLTGKLGDVYSGTWSGGTLAPEIDPNAGTEATEEETVEETTVEETESVEETTSEVETTPDTTAAETVEATTEAAETTEATETTVAQTEATEAVTEASEATTAPATETESTAPVETKKYLFTPSADQLKDADELKLVVQDSENNIYTFELTPTAAVVDGKTVYSANVPAGLNSIVLMYQFYKEGKWVSQVTVSGEDIKQLDGKIVDSDGKIIDANIPASSETEQPTTVAPATSEATAAPTIAPETTQPATEKPATVTKRDNTLKVTAKNKIIKAAKLKKGKVVLSLLKIKNAKGSVKVVKVSKGSTKLLYKVVKVAAKTGKITLMKGAYLRKTYKLKLKVTAKGNKDYKSKSISKIVKIKVK